MMRRLEMGEGLVAEVRVHHNPRPEREGQGRLTTVKVAVKWTAPGEAEESVLEELVGESNCSPLDNFDRAVGRYQALLRVFAADDARKKLLSRQVRTQIWEVVMPKVKAAKREAMRKVREHVQKGRVQVQPS